MSVISLTTQRSAVVSIPSPRRALACIAILGLVAACSSPSPHPATVTVPHPAPTSPVVTPPSTPSVAITVRSLFCAYGGVGIIPVPTPPDFETNFAEHAFEIDNPGPPVLGITVLDASLRDPSGAVIAPMLRLDHLVDLTHEPPPDPTWGSFAVYMNPTGTPFTGTLPTGTTRLRARYSTTGTGMTAPSHCHVTLGGLGAPLSVEGPVDGSWPTS